MVLMSDFFFVIMMMLPRYEFVFEGIGRWSYVGVFDLMRLPVLWRRDLHALFLVVERYSLFDIVRNHLSG